MNFKLRVVALAAALILGSGMTAGIAVAQDNPSSDSGNITFTMPCISTAGANASTPSTAGLVANGNANFEDLDPSDPDQLALRSTGTKALRVAMNINPCLIGAWHVDATITDFTSSEGTIPGTSFRLPIGDPLSSTSAHRADSTAVPGVVAPSTSFVTFGAGSPHPGSHAIAISSGTNTGEMFMDFTGQLVNLDAETPDGTYTAQIAVTFTPGAP